MKERWPLWSLMENLCLLFSVPTSPLGSKTLKIRNKFVYFDHCHCLILLQDKWRIARNPINFPAWSNLSELLHFNTTNIIFFSLWACLAASSHSLEKYTRRNLVYCSYSGCPSMLSGLLGSLQMPQPVGKIAYTKICLLYGILCEWDSSRIL